MLQSQPETPRCVVTSTGNFLRRSHLQINCVHPLILSPGGWDTIATHLKVHQSGIFEYAFQLPDRAERWQVKARWELRDGLCYGTLLEQMPLDGAIAPVYVMPITAEDDKCTDQVLKVGHNDSIKPIDRVPVMTATDSEFLDRLNNWLEPITPRPQISITGGDLIAKCQYDANAYNLVNTASWLKTTNIKRLYFIVGDSYRGWVSTDKLKTSNQATTMQTLRAAFSAETMLSAYAKQNAREFDSEPGITFIHSADADTGYKILAVRSEITDARLNKPIADLLGQPLSFVDNQISVAAKRVIEAAIADPSQVHYDYYDYQDPPNSTGFCALWRFQVSALYLPEYGEVRRKTLDNPQDPRAAWQEPAWRYGQGSNILVASR